MDKSLIKLPRKAVIIAGNGPSLTKIDYRRFPLDAEVWRSNQFFREKKYYVGRRVDRCYFTSADNTQKPLYNYLLTYLKLDLNDEYVFNWGNFKWRRLSGDEGADFDFQEDLWSVNCMESTGSLDWLSPLIQIYRMALHSVTLKGTDLFIKALLEGYTDIYLTGMDGDYSHGCYPWQNEGEPNLVIHDPCEQIHIIKTAKRMACSNIWNLSEHSPIVKHIAMAPLLDETPTFIPDDKPETAIKDILKSPYVPLLAQKAMKRIYPGWLVNFVCLFVFNKKRRRRIRDTYIKR